MRETISVVFTPSGIRGEVPKGTDILAAARQLGVDLDTVCGGNGVCARCKVQLSVGDFSKYQIHSQPSHFSKHSAAEKQLFGEHAINQGFRLGCKTQLLGDAIVDIPSESQVHQQVVRKDMQKIDMVAAPAVELVTVDVAEPKLEMPSGDLERLLDAIEFSTGLTQLNLDTHILPSLQSVLRLGDWTVTVAIYKQSCLIAIWPGEHTQIIGLAVDIGSTTIAGHLSDLQSGEILASAGKMNPQIRFGEDVMSRVSYVMMNPGGDQQMTDAVRVGINQLIDDLLAASQAPRDALLDAVLVGNPIMHHLFLGIDPVELGGAPFALATQAAQTISSDFVKLKLAAGARVYMLPCIAGHVGADAAAVVLAEAPYKQDAITLIIDIGTNAEIVLGNKDKLVAASSPTGPAFEGAQISHGQRAAKGAIERVRIDPKSLEPRIKVIGVDAWSDEAGFDEGVAKTGITGICGSGIIEAVACLYLAGVICNDGVISAEKAQESSRVFLDGKTYAYCLVEPSLSEGSKIIITQNDVRAIQLAKATLYASVKLLMDKLEIKAIERTRFAGAFGAQIDPKYAMVLGMIPDCPLEEVIAVGNAAGTGAHIALLSQAARAEIEIQVDYLEKIETATEVNFQKYFIDAMAFPHQKDTFPHLSGVVTWPTRKVTSQASRRSRRRRDKA